MPEYWKDAARKTIIAALLICVLALLRSVSAQEPKVPKPDSTVCAVMKSVAHDTSKKKLFYTVVASDTEKVLAHPETAPLGVFLGVRYNLDFVKGAVVAARSTRECKPPKPRKSG